YRVRINSLLNMCSGRTRHKVSLVRAFILLVFDDQTPTEICTLSLHDALPILCQAFHQPGSRCANTLAQGSRSCRRGGDGCNDLRSEEHTSELQSRFDLVCRLLLEKKKQSRGVHYFQQNIGRRNSSEILQIEFM